MKTSLTRHALIVSFAAIMLVTGIAWHQANQEDYESSHLTLKTTVQNHMQLWVSAEDVLRIYGPRDIANGAELKDWTIDARREPVVTRRGNHWRITFK